MTGRYNGDTSRLSRVNYVLVYDGENYLLSKKGWRQVNAKLDSGYHYNWTFGNWKFKAVNYWSK